MGKIGEEVRIDKIKFKIVDTPYEKGCTKSLIEITSNEIVKGKVVLKIWNLSKKGGTIQITQCKGESYENVKILAEEGINVLLEDSKNESNKYFKENLVNASKIEPKKVIKRLETPKQLQVEGSNIKRKSFKCDECNIERASKKTLNNHKDKKHKGTIVGLEEKIQRFKCEHCGIEQSSSRMLRIHQHEAHIGSKHLAGAKRTTDGKIKSNDTDDTSPVKKKKKDEVSDFVYEIEAMDDIDIITLGNFEFANKVQNVKVHQSQIFKSLVDGMMKKS